MLKTETKASLTEVLSLVQKTVLNAATELEDEAKMQVARISLEVQESRRERDEALHALHAAELSASRHQNEVSAMRATIENLQREVVHWKEQAKNWQDHYTRVEQDRCGLSTELLALSRSALTETPPKQYSAPSSVTKRASTSSNRPPAYKSAVPPSPTESDSPLQSISAQRNPHTPAAKSARQAPSGRADLPPYPSDDASASTAQLSRTGKAKAKQVQTPSQAPRQIFVRRVHAVVNVKEEEDDDDLEDEEEEASESVRLIKRRRSALVIQDDDDSASGSDVDNSRRNRDEDSGDELSMNPHQEVYGGVRPVLPTPASTTSIRTKRLPNVTQQTEASPTKRRRVSDTTRKTLAKRK
ncbi:hypothetical protein B0H15DRAFT_69590 [Mycena belliarum]|uniref:Uncharacterized protein n=1 Tax=Mycena belliarum TaxID=1033014 RepID=A0AAD6UGB2_9AGAR|nr:hypothetical protein B0H15DRAFT_69590 [Mycena belliae]